jgi:hypothetical protein
MTKNFHLVFVLPLFLLLQFASIGLAAQDRATGPTLEDAVWTWADDTGSQHAVFIGRQAGAKWEEPVRVSANEGVNVAPSAIKTAGQDLFVVWSYFAGTRAQLHYRQCKNGVWTEEKEFYTGLSSNTAPSILIDTSGIVRLVWAGFNGISDEIYFSTWNGDAFETAQPLTANDIPDILPVLGMDDATGQPRVQWQQFTETGYRKLEAAWNGSAWSTPVESATPATTEGGDTPADLRTFTLKKVGPSATAEATGQPASAAGETNSGLEVEVPAFIRYPESASIHIPGYPIQSLPVRSVLEIE